MTNTQLQLAIARLLSEKIEIRIGGDSELPNDTVFFFWKGGYEIRPTEWEHIVRLVEEKLTDFEYESYFWQLDVVCNPTPLSLGWPKRCMNILKATVEQRAAAILKVKGVEV